MASERWPQLWELMCRLQNKEDMSMKLNLKNEIKRAINAVIAGETVDEAVEALENYVNENYLCKESFENINSISVGTASDLYGKLGLSLRGHNGKVEDVVFEEEN